jgi:hypothetical protein
MDHFYDKKSAGEYIGVYDLLDSGHR